MSTDLVMVVVVAAAVMALVGGRGGVGVLFGRFVSLSAAAVWSDHLASSCLQLRRRSRVSC